MGFWKWWRSCCFDVVDLFSFDQQQQQQQLQLHRRRLRRRAGDPLAALEAAPPRPGERQAPDAAPGLGRGEGETGPARAAAGKVGAGLFEEFDLFFFFWSFFFFLFRCRRAGLQREAAGAEGAESFPALVRGAAGAVRPLVARRGRGAGLGGGGARGAGRGREVVCQGKEVEMSSKKKSKGAFPFASSSSSSTTTTTTTITSAPDPVWGRCPGATPEQRVSLLKLLLDAEVERTASWARPLSVPSDPRSPYARFSDHKWRGLVRAAWAVSPKLALSLPERLPESDAVEEALEELVVRHAAEPELQGVPRGAAILANSVSSLGNGGRMKKSDSSACGCGRGRRR